MKFDNFFYSHNLCVSWNGNTVRRKRDSDHCSGLKGSWPNSHESQPVAQKLGNKSRTLGHRFDVHWEKWELFSKYGMWQYRRNHLSIFMDNMKLTSRGLECICASALLLLRSWPAGFLAVFRGRASVTFVYSPWTCRRSSAPTNWLSWIMSPCCTTWNY